MMRMLDKFPKTVAIVALVVGLGSALAAVTMPQIPEITGLQPLMAIGGLSTFFGSLLLGIRALSMDPGES